jgi:hypothetical protein
LSGVSERELACELGWAGKMNECSGSEEAEEKRPGIRLLRSWLNKNIKVDFSLAVNPYILDEIKLSLF